MGVVAGVGATGVFLRYYLPNTHFLQQSRAVTQLYSHGSEVKVSPKVKSLIQEVLSDLGMSEAERGLIATYTVYGFDPFHAGSTLVRTGGILGTPVSFQYTCEEDFDHTGIVVNNAPVPWSTPAGEALKASLVLSKEAKKFVLAREVVSLRTGEPFISGALASTVVGMVYFTSSGINKSQNYYGRPRSLRFVLYSLVGLFGLAFWSLGKDVTTVKNETEADETVANLGEEYARGGLEYYEKILQRNIALRTLLGDKGENLYTAYGNDEVLFRTRHQPFTMRRDAMKARVEEYERDEGKLGAGEKDGGKGVDGERGGGKGGAGEKDGGKGGDGEKDGGTGGAGERDGGTGGAGSQSSTPSTSQDSKEGGKNDDGR